MEEQEKAEEIAEALDLSVNAESIAMEYAIEKLLPAHVTEVKSARLAHINKVEHAVKTRLISEIRYWDQRANELKLREDSGRVNALEL